MNSHEAPEGGHAPGCNSRIDADGYCLLPPLAWALWFHAIVYAYSDSGLAMPDSHGLEPAGDLGFHCHDSLVTCDHTASRLGYSATWAAEKFKKKLMKRCKVLLSGSVLASAVVSGLLKASVMISDLHNCIRPWDCIHAVVATKCRAHHDIVADVSAAADLTKVKKWTCVD